MNRIKCIVLILSVCLLLVTTPHAESGDAPDSEEEAGTMIILTGLNTDGPTLDLSWKIRNGSDHDIWICMFDFDTYMAKDNRTLVIRRRFDLPMSGDVLISRPWAIKGPYLRLRPGQVHAESLSLEQPAGFDRLFEVDPGNAQHATRLTLEIGFYDEDLRSLILRIVGMAEKLNCTGTSLSDTEIYARYFPGLWIAGRFNGDVYQYFKDSVNGEGEEILMPPMAPARLGEEVLRLTVDDVSIPYESKLWSVG